MKNKYYLIAKVENESKSFSHSSSWPKVIGFSFENMSLLFMEGKGHGLQGGIVPLSRFNSTEWRDFFSETNSEWFLDLVNNANLATDKQKQDVNLFGGGLTGWSPEFTTLADKNKQNADNQQSQAHLWIWQENTLKKLYTLNGIAEPIYLAEN